jgi:hypothetical protein
MLWDGVKRGDKTETSRYSGIFRQGRVAEEIKLTLLLSRVGVIQHGRYKIEKLAFACLYLIEQERLERHT